MKLFKYIATAFLVGATTLSAHTIKDDINVIGGYMHGKFKQESTLFFPSGSPTGIVPGHVNPDTIKSRLDFGVVGVNGHFFVPELDCLCSYPFLHNIYITGHAIWGWADKNKFTERSTGFNPTGQPLPPLFADNDFLARGKTNGRSYDYSIGAGYLLDLSCIGLDCLGFDLSGWALGIEGGYSYRRIHLKTKHADDGAFLPLNPAANFFTPNDPTYHGTRYQNKWDGGWVGGELFYQGCAWNLVVGYEHNFSKYRGYNNTTAFGLATGFDSATLKSNHAHGNTWTIQANYDIACGFTVGAFFEYETWNARKGSMRITAPAGGFLGNTGTTDVKSRIHSSWDAYTIAGTIGYEF